MQYPCNQPHIMVMKMAISLKYSRMVYYFLVVVYLFQSQLTTVGSLIIGRNNKHPIIINSNKNANYQRRSFLWTVTFGGYLTKGAPVFANDSIACRPPNKKKRKVSDVRDLIDTAVQASSVQAFTTASELINDALLDSSVLKSLLLESCNNNNDQQITEILESIESMRFILKQNSSTTNLTTNDIKDIMQYGTTARSGIDSLFGL